MKRLTIALLLTAAFLPLMPAMMRGAGMEGVRPVASASYGLQVDLWTDRPEGYVYEAGSGLGIYFRTNRDCFLTLYDISTEGRVSIIFPRYPDDGFVFGGVTYRLPEYYPGLDLYVDGPTGIEYLHAVATTHPRAFRYPAYAGEYHLEFGLVRGDPFLAINRINSRIIFSHHVGATATTSFFVGAQVWYPRYMCGDCHSNGPAWFDPYASSCSHYVVHTTAPYDYWWKYGYHPGYRNHAYVGGFWTCVPRPIPTHRHRVHAHLHCASGYANYHPVILPASPHTQVKYRNPAQASYRGYTRSYTTVGYVDMYARRTGISRAEAERRAPVIRTERRSGPGGSGANPRGDVSDPRGVRMPGATRGAISSAQGDVPSGERIVAPRSSDTRITPGRVREESPSNAETLGRTADRTESPSRERSLPVRAEAASVERTTSSRVDVRPAGGDRVRDIHLTIPQASREERPATTATRRKVSDAPSLLRDAEARAASSERIPATTMSPGRASDRQSHDVSGTGRAPAQTERNGSARAGTLRERAR